MALIPWLLRLLIGRLRGGGGGGGGGYRGGGYRGGGYSRGGYRKPQLSEDQKQAGYWEDAQRKGANLADLKGGPEGKDPEGYGAVNEAYGAGEDEEDALLRSLNVGPDHDPAEVIRFLTNRGR